MYAVGNLPDHVTRYNHKDPNRWMVQAGPSHHVSAWDVMSRAAVMMCVSALIVAAVVILQGVAI